MSAALIDPRPAPPVRVTKPRRLCEACGVVFVPHRGNNPNRFCSCRCANSRHDPKFVAAVRRLWRLGCSLNQIAALLSVTRGVVSGIKTRHPGFAPRPSPIRSKAVG